MREIKEFYSDRSSISGEDHSDGSGYGYGDDSFGSLAAPATKGAPSFRRGSHFHAETSRFEAKEELKSSLKEHEKVSMSTLRSLVLLLWIATMVAVSALVFTFQTKGERAAFEYSFVSNSLHLIDAFHHAMEREIASIDSLSKGITAYAINEGLAFPNVSLPDFGIRASGVHSNTGSSGPIYWAPLVTEDQRTGWETFSSANVEQLTQQLATEAVLWSQEEQGGRGKNGTEETTINDFIFEFEGAIQSFYSTADSDKIKPSPANSGPYLPLGQMSPALPRPNVLNFNFAADPLVRDSFVRVLERKKAVIGIADSYYVVDKEAPESAVLGGSDGHTIDPHSVLVFPVFESFTGEGQSVVAGMIVVKLVWGAHFQNVLQEDAKGFIMVLENSYGQSFSYEVDGSAVVYLGEEDAHSEKYEDLVIAADLLGMISDEDNGSAILMDKDNWHILRIYPSQITEDAFMTKQPLIFTFIVAAILFFSCIIFITYDCTVFRRQRVVMDRAIAAGEIVTALYPANVRDKMYKEKAQTGSHHSERKQKFLQKPALLAMSFHSSRHDPALDSDDDEADAEEGQSPSMADLYENTTVMFGDLVGFTKWSSDRSPADVFTLLEAVYKSWDSIASKRDVFKVETIGDCYLAVTGIPRPQDDHAVRMVRFAKDCMVQLRKVTEDLAVSLGEETKDIQVRVGIHSGPTIAGVLRGLKGRFQLFGDTVNTAARMESTGVAGRIQVSQRTADELCQYGQEGTLIKRENPIVAKGKGELQTYFVITGTSKSSVTTATSSSRSLLAERSLSS